MNGKRLICHKSQQKFQYHSNHLEEEHRKLEMVGYSKSQHSTLYKDALLFLTVLGLSRSTITQISKESIHEKCEQFSSVENLRDETRNSSSRMEQVLNSMLSAGFTLSNPYVKQCVCKMYENYVEKTTKTEARIPIEKSAFLLMVPDFTGTLAPNEIFIHFSDPSEFEHRILTGEVVLFRSPLQKLSDVQIMKAVDCPNIHYIKDCVVFSTQGETPPASLLAGGDYDGDKAWVIWDERFLEISTFPPTQAPDLSKSVLPHELGVQKLCDIPLQNLQQQLLDYCSTQNAFVYLGYYSNKLSEELRVQYCKLARQQKFSPNEIAASLSQNKRILRYAHLCAAAVDAPKAGQRIKGEPRSLGHQKKELQIPWFTQLADRFVLDLPSASMQIDKDLMNNEIPMESYGDAIQILVHALAHTPDLDSQKLRQLKEKLTGAKFTARERVCFVSYCYQLYHQEDPSCTHLWNMFCEELCRLKADTVALRERGRLSISIVHDHFHSC